MTPTQELTRLGLTPNEAESLLRLLLSWRRLHRDGLAAWLQRCAINKAGGLMASRESKFDTPQFCYEMGRAKALAEVTDLIDNLYEELKIGDLQ